MIVKIWGGLGNQLFQYAFAKALSKKHNCQVWLDCTEYELNNVITKREFKLNLFNIDLPIATNEILNKSRIRGSSDLIFNLKLKIFSRLPRHFTNYIFEQGLVFKSENLVKARYYIGYWQSEKYFTLVKDELGKDLELKHRVLKGDSRFLADILNSESVSVHVRRGDYATNPKINKTHGLLSNEYYEAAINRIFELIPNARIFIFSDDMNWVKENMFKGRAVNFINSQSAEEDFELMSFCKHNIIANSSFSWWAAYLNKNKNKTIIAPKEWFNNSVKNDLIPGEWEAL